MDFDFLKDYEELIISAKEALSKEYKYEKAHKLAIQANLIAKKYLEDKEKCIDSMLVQSLAYLKLDSMQGHEHLRDLYIKPRYAVF